MLPRAAAAARRARRGFTIPELLAVIVIIGIFAAVASPMFIQLMRDRRVNKAAMEISGVYRLARGRALGRGNAVLVRWSAADTRFDVRETLFERYTSVISSNCASVANWLDPATTQAVTDLRLAGAPYELAGITFQDEGGGAQGFADICFSPRGRTFIRYAPAAPFTTLVGVPRVAVQNTRTGLTRTVHIPPNGIARLAL